MKFNLFVLLAIVFLAGLFIFIKPQNKVEAPKNSQPSTAQATIAPTPEETIKTFALVFKNKKLVSGKSTIQVTQNDTVMITITSDEAEELHIHGYDVSVDLEKDKEASVSFKANLSGRFPFELEHSKKEVGAVEVAPK